MNMQARFSAKGQIVIPKDVRDRYRFANGDVVDVVETAEGVLLKRPVVPNTEPFDVILARLRASVRYDGPRMTIEQLSWSPDVENDTDQA